MAQPVATVIPGLYQMALPTPFPVGRVNVYLALDADALTLIDVGVNSDRAYDELVEGLAALGLTPAHLDRIIVTHHHVDHSGLAGRLVAESGAEVACHPWGRPYLECPAATQDQVTQWTLAACQEGGVPPAVLDMLTQAMLGIAAFGNAPVPVTHELDEGDTLTLLGRPWTVYHTPGHAGDLICFYEPQSRVLLSSDHLLRDISSNALMEPPQPGQKRPRRLLEYMAQLERIAALDIQTAYGGHGEPATHVLDLVAQRLVFHRQRADYILALMGDEALTLFQVTQRMFAHVPEAQQFLALSEVLGHLDWLERDGALRRTMVDDLTLWQRA